MFKCILHAFVFADLAAHLLNMLNVWQHQLKHQARFNTTCTMN